ncbi:MAG TPA: cytochrome c [Alphaproteobacteria bacterium]|nr:cytochrome c [Alphaproteobacteria bacterium]
MADDTSAASPGEGSAPYSVVDGKVDAWTYDGFRRYNAACNHCHGPDGAGGSFGPSLIAAPLPPDAFRAAVLDGRGSGTFVMKGYAGDPNVAPYVDAIYAYLRGRADGAIGRGRPLRAEQR